jgi:hypothetical protein
LTERATGLLLLVAGTVFHLSVAEMVFHLSVAEMVFHPLVVGHLLERT